LSEKSPLEFPCRFPVKAMTRAPDPASDADPVKQVVAAVENHTGRLDSDAVRVRDSAKGNYLAVTVVIQAESRDQLDAIYRELTAMDEVVMTL